MFRFNMTASLRVIRLHFALVRGRSLQVLSLLARSRPAISQVIARNLSSPRPSRKADESLPNAVEEQNIEEQKPKILDLAEKPIRSKRVPTVTPSSHVTEFELAIQKGTSRQNYISVLENFNRNNKTRRGHMELIRISMDYMDKFGLEADLETYNAMLNVFPRGRFENRTLFDAIWPKRHPQVDLALELLTKMEENVVKPSLYTYDLCEEIFGKASQPVQKCRRLAYWLTKLEEMFPHPLPKDLPEDQVQLSQLAIARMLKETVPIITYQEKGVNFIVGSQTMEQKSILDNYDIEKPVYVEGPYTMWIRRLKRHYFVLRGHAVDDINTNYTDQEGTVLAVCMTSSDNIQDNLRQWVSRLQEQSPNLAKMKVVFNLKEDLKRPEHNGESQLLE